MEEQVEQVLQIVFQVQRLLMLEVEEVLVTFKLELEEQVEVEPVHLEDLFVLLEVEYLQ
jgi:hypothetical protein